MDVRILGPMAVEEQGRSILPTAAKPRQVLALLALRGDHLVTVPTLTEEIWGEHPPRSAATTLQTYILQLRRLIGDALGHGSARSAKDVLVTRPSGYLLAVSPGTVDAAAFEAAVVQGRRACAQGDPRATSELLGRALALWRGPALVDVPVGPILELDVMALEEARMAALEHRIEADLNLGLHTQLVGELRVLTRQYPMNENLHRQLMTAFYRSGSVWRALEAYQTLRGTLRDELGLEPSAPVQRLHHAILTADPAIEEGDLLLGGDRLAA